MKKQTAKIVIEQYERYGEIFDRITEISYDIDDIAERKLVRRAAADAQAILYEGFVQPIVKEYPDLDPHSSDSDT